MNGFSWFPEARTIWDRSRLLRHAKSGDPTGCPWSCPTPWGLRQLNLSQMVLAPRNHSLLSYSSTFVSTTLLKNQIWGSHSRSLLMPYSLRSKEPGPVPDGPGLWKPTETIHYYHTLQILFQWLCWKINSVDPIGCPWSWPTPWGLKLLNLSQMVLAFQKSFKMTNWYMVFRFCITSYLRQPTGT